MTQKTKLITVCLLALVLSACSQTETSKPGTTASSSNTSEASNSSATVETSAKAPPADVVRVETPSVEIKAGSSGEAAVKLTIASGYHINANPPSFSYLKATELQIET